MNQIHWYCKYYINDNNFININRVRNEDIITQQYYFDYDYYFPKITRINWQSDNKKFIERILVPQSNILFQKINDINILDLTGEELVTNYSAIIELLQNFIRHYHFKIVNCDTDMFKLYISFIYLTS